MKTKCILILTSIFLWVWGSRAQSNLSLQLIRPKEFSLKTADLWNCILTNTSGQPMHIQLTGVVTEKKRGKMYEVISGAFDLAPGITQFNTQNYESLKGEKILTRNVPFEDHILRTNTLPNGEYTVCVSVLGIYGETKARSCIDQTINRITSINLIMPRNRDTTCLSNPFFNWMAYSQTGLQSDLVYGFRLYEMLPHQTAMAAVTKNPPFYKEDKIRDPLFQYPLHAIPLKNNTAYAWQVILLSGDKVISQSPVFHYYYRICQRILVDGITLNGGGQKEDDPKKDSAVVSPKRSRLRYHSLTDAPGSPVTIMDSKITVGLDCFPQVEHLYYQIKDAQGEIRLKDEIILSQGINFKEINLTTDFRHDVPYLLTVYDQYGKKKYLTFLQLTLK